MANISLNDFLKIDYNCNIIDIRSIQSFNNNHIPYSINIPYNKLLLNPDKYINKNEIYYLYCQRGMTSENVSNILNRLGYKTYSINGGYEEWILSK